MNRELTHFATGAYMSNDDTDHGYRWSVAIECGREMDYRTNKSGEGLFYWSSNNQWQQSAGCGQFSLPRDAKKAKAKLKKAITKANSRYV
jgi:hypothetical protein